MQTITAAADLSPEILLALQAGVKKAIDDVEKAGGDLKDRATPNQTLKGLSVNIVLTLDEVAIGADTDKSPTCSIPLLPTLALMVKRMGCTRDAALTLIREVMQQALTMDKDATKALLEEAGVAEAETQIKTEVIGKLPRTKVQKAVRIKGASLTVTGISQAA